MWNATSGARVARELHAGTGFTSVVFSPAGERVVSGASDGSIRFHDLAGSLSATTLEPGLSSVLGLAFTPAGETLVVGGWEASVLLETGPPRGGFARRALAREARERVNEAFAELESSEDGAWGSAMPRAA